MLKWDPSDAKDSSQFGITSPAIVDAYRLDGTLLWRVNVGYNIRAGAHDTQLVVYDLDGDGRTELLLKTADGTTSGVVRAGGYEVRDVIGQPAATAERPAPPNNFGEVVANRGREGDHFPEVANDLGLSATGTAPRRPAE